MKYLFIVIVMLIGLLQWILWFGHNGIVDLWETRQNLEVSNLENEKLKNRNDALKAEVVDLQTGLQAIEERARSELGLVREDETFIQIIEQAPKE